MTNLEDLFKKVLVYIGDLHRMEIRLNDLEKEARNLGIKLEDVPESKKTIKRLNNEANFLHDNIDNELK